MTKRHLFPATLAVLCALLALPAIGFAHAAIKSYSPKPGSTVSRSLKSVTVTFEERIIGGSLSVKSAGGAAVSRGKGSLVNGGKALRATLNGGLKKGRHTASTRWVSDDGHKQTKSWSFRLR
jgi:methionine-rich copper-binding protein CopC